MFLLSNALKVQEQELRCYSLPSELSDLAKNCDLMPNFRSYAASVAASAQLVEFHRSGCESETDRAGVDHPLASRSPPHFAKMYPRARNPVAGSRHPMQKIKTESCLQNHPARRRLFHQDDSANMIQSQLHCRGHASGFEIANRIYGN